MLVNFILFSSSHSLSFCLFANTLKILISFKHYNDYFWVLPLLLSKLYDSFIILAVKYASSFRIGIYYIDIVWFFLKNTE